MKTTVNSAPAGTTLTLPMTIIFSVVMRKDCTIAHALDFDLVAVAPTEVEAVRKIRLAVKHHVEYGLKNHFDLDILQTAPEKDWAALTLDAKLSIGEPIVVCDRRILTATKTTTQNDYNGSLAAA